MPFPLLDTATELLTEIILPLLEARDVVALGRTCRQLHSLILDKANPESEFIWKTRIKNDLRFPVESTARQSGWLDLYRKIRVPHVYLWGEGRNGRLAIERDDIRLNLMTRSGSIPIPARLHIKVPVVDLVAGGWSFHVLSVHGKVYHWGQLDGGSFAPYRPASTSSIPLVAYPGAMVSSVTELAAAIPPITRMLSGRLHVLATDDNGRLWTWAQWAQAGLVSASWLDYSKFRIADFAAGWTFSATLLEDRQTKHRTAHVWWQRFLSPTLQRSTRPPTEQARFTMPEGIEGRQGCFHFDPQQAIKLPDLGTTDSEEHIEKLAAGEGYIIALSNMGKVYKLDLGQPILPLYGGMAVQPHLQGLVPQQQLDEDDDDDLEDGRMPRRSFAELERQLATGQRRWEYLEKFSESRYWPAEVDPFAAAPEQTTSSKHTPDLVGDKLEMNSRKIGFISANFRTFFCIGDGAVLQGSSEAHEDTAPIIKQELQNRGVIRVECGDYHFGALTASGELLAFGGYSNGALGLGLDNNRLDPSVVRRSLDRSVPIPSRVSFLDPARPNASSTPDEYCFNLAMAGWASGALCVNLQDSAEADEDERTDVRVVAAKGKQREKAEDSDQGNSGSTTCSTDDNVSGSNATEEINEQHNQHFQPGAGTIGSHRRLLPGVFGRGVLPFRIGYAGRGATRGRGGGRGAGSAAGDQL